MDSQQNKSNSERKGESLTHKSGTNSGGTNHSQDSNWPRYWIMEGTDGSNPLSKMNPFLVSKAIQGISSTLGVKRLRNGSLLLECDRSSQARTLQGISQLGSVPVRVSPHKSMNTCQGIIRCRDISDMTEDDIQLELSAQGVTKVRQFIARSNGHIKKTGTFLLTFNSTTLPQSINVGYLRVKVEVYVPNPLRCFSCQKFGHGQHSCKGQPVCTKCGKQEHGDDPCTGPLNCVNCAGNHSSNSKQCPVWLKEREIQKVKALQKLPYSEAKRQVEASNHNPPKAGTYASVVSHKVSVGTQTEPTQQKDENKKSPEKVSAACSATGSLGSPSPSKNQTNKDATAKSAVSSKSSPQSGPNSSDKSVCKGAAEKPAAAAKPSRSSKSVSSAQKADASASAKDSKDTEKPKIKLVRNNGPRNQKGTNDPIREGLDMLDDELDSVSSKKGKGKSNTKSKLQS